MDQKASFYQFNFQELHTMLQRYGLNSAHTSTLFNWYYKRKETSLLEKDISHGVRKLLAEELDFQLPQIVHTHESADRTVKFILKLEDGNTIESVLIPFHGKYTQCLSSQVGCAMNCSFCFTGTQGLTRHLKTQEIIGQFIVAWTWLKKNRPQDDDIKNLVFMGQGEPLHNFDAVKKACEILIDQHGASLGVQKITISTAGYVPGLKRWVAEMPPVNIALSLHALDETKRNQLIPLNKRYGLTEVLNYLETIPLARKQFLTFEYLMIKDFNDSDLEAHEIGRRFQGQQVILNLIPFNPFPGSQYQRPDHDRVQSFLSILESYRLPSFIRGTKGDDILAACGQLNTSTKTNS